MRAHSSRLFGRHSQAIQPHGAAVERDTECRFEPAPAAGYSRTSSMPRRILPTQIRLDGDWVEVEGMEMDLGILCRPGKGSCQNAAHGIGESQGLDRDGREGIRVTPLARPRERDVFGFMESVVSSERPHQPVIADIAQRMLKLRAGYRQGQTGTKVLLAGGPAIVHAGGREALDLVDRSRIYPCLVLWQCVGRARYGSRVIRHVSRIWIDCWTFRSAWT